MNTKLRKTRLDERIRREFTFDTYPGLFFHRSEKAVEELTVSSISSEVRVVTIKSKVSTFLPEGHNLISREDKRRTRILSTFAIKQPQHTFTQVRSSRDTPRFLPILATSCPSFPSFLPSFLPSFSSFSLARHGSQLRTKQPLYL